MSKTNQSNRVRVYLTQPQVDHVSRLNAPHDKIRSLLAADMIKPINLVEMRLPVDSGGILLNIYLCDEMSSYLDKLKPDILKQDYIKLLINQDMKLYPLDNAAKTGVKS